MTDTRNIVDFYKYWTNEAINVHLDTKRHPFGVLCSNIGYDYNISVIIRNNNAFLAKEVYLYGKKTWDKRGAVGTHHYTHVHHLPCKDDLNKIHGYTWIAIDNIKQAIPINEFKWPINTLMCFGQEDTGIPSEILERCQNVVYIPQFGSVRSLNVGTSSGIAMYDYTDKLLKGQLSDCNCNLNKK